eukprot:GFKZ01001022.1.p1 GENE.GFKZ01001022.1~~GFKZ01001022.1.p1  ORF type:complete len:262 (+),score=20.76 GFKZ01001022.1:1248-2033(+)
MSCTSSLPSPISASPLISPFLLSPSSLPPLPHPLPKSPLVVQWLHLPATLHPLPSPLHALDLLHLMSPLRHPNLQQLLGALIQPPSPAILTQHIPGPFLNRLLDDISPKKRARFLKVNLLNIALDIARALVYFHQQTGTAHANINTTNVVWDHVRSRAVLVLVTPTHSFNLHQQQTASLKGHLAFSQDVHMFARFVSIMADDTAVATAHILPANVRRVLAACMTESWQQRPTMAQVCALLSDSLQWKERSRTAKALHWYAP